MGLDDILKIASARNDTYVFAYETLYGRRFDSYGDDYVSQMPPRVKDEHMYEVLCFNTGVYFYIDIDTDVDIQCVISYVKRMCYDIFGFEITTHVATACSDTKKSYHIVTSLPLASVRDAANLSGRMQYESPSMIFDSNVYKAHQNWRMLYQSKVSDPNRPFVPYHSTSDISKHMIGIYKKTTVYECSFGVPKGVNNIVNSNGIDITHYLDKTLSPRPDQKASESLEYLMSCIPNTSQGQPWITWLYLGFALKNAGADISVWVKWSNTWSGHDQTNKCDQMWNTFEKRCDGFNIGTIIRCANEYVPNPFNNHVTSEISDIHELQKSDVSFEYNNQYVLPYVFPETSKCLLERSHMGTGKTFQLFRYIEAKNPKRIIHLAARQDYANSIHGEYVGNKIVMDNYLDMEGRSPHLSDRIIIQMESLWKLSDGDQTFDLVILDEIESLLKQWSSVKTMKNRIKMNAVLFEKILKNASHIIGMDAFLSKKSIMCMKNMGIHPCIRHNIHQPYTRKAVNCGSKNGIVSQLIRELVVGKKCVLFTASQRFGIDVEQTVREQFGFKHVRYYHSGCDDATRNDLKNVHIHWKELDLLIYSPCITVGINYSLDTFDTLFLYGSCMSSNIRDCFQSSLRVRNIKSCMCYYAIHTKVNRHNIPTSESEISRDISINVDMFNYHDVHICPEWLLHVHISNVREDNFHMKHFRDVWNTFLLWCGYTIIDTQLCNDHAIQRANTTHFSDIATCDEDGFSAASDLIARRMATSDIKSMYMKHVFESHIVRRDTSLVYASYIFDAFYSKKTKQHIIRNIRDELYSTPETIAEVELSRASYVELAATRTRSTTFHTVHNLSKSIGVACTHDPLSPCSPDDKPAATRLINEWSGTSLVKCKHDSDRYRIKKKNNIASCL
jgi:hypothetical protein